MSPELQLYYEGVKMAAIAEGANIPERKMKSRLGYERTKLGLITRKKTHVYVSEDVAEFVSDKSIVIQLAKEGLSFKSIGDKWDVDQNTVSKYLSQWGMIVDKEIDLDRVTLAGLYTGWADIPQGKEMLLTINRKPMFKLVRII